MAALKKSEKLMLAAIGVLVVVFVAMDPYYMLYRDPPEEVSEPAKPGGKGSATKPAKQTQQSSSKSGKGGKKDVEEEPVVDNRPKREAVEFDSWGRDPFVQARRTFDDAQAISTLRLGGLSVRGEDRYALINSQIVRAGDAIEGLVVSRIESDRVLLSKGGQTYTLTWGPR